MKTIFVQVSQTECFTLRRWLMARDPTARIETRAGEADLWHLKIKVSLPYLARAAERRWPRERQASDRPPTLRGVGRKAWLLAR